MRKVTLALFIVFLIGMFVGCDNSVDLPDGFQNQDFYRDATECLRLVERALKTKDLKYVDEFDKLMDKNGDDVFRKQLTDKENQVFQHLMIVRMKLQAYLDDDVVDDSYSIDQSQWTGESLVIALQRTIEAMNIDYNMSDLY